MAVTARVATGVKALYVVITEHGRTTSAIIPREAFEKCWDIGPEQEDLLHAFAAHKDEIEEQVRHQALSAHGDVLLIKELVTVAASPSLRSGAPMGQGTRA